MDKEESFEKHVSKNALISIGCSCFQFMTRFFIPAIVLHYVPMNVYGLWAYCFVFITYMGTSVIGITNVYVRYSAIHLVHHEIGKINQLLSTGMICSFFMSLIFLIGSWFALPHLFPLLQIHQELRSTAFFLIFGTLSVFSFEMTVSIYKFLLHGLQKVGLQGIIQTGCQVLETLLILYFLYSGYGIFSLFYAYTVQAILANIIYAIVCYRFIPELSIKPQLFSLSILGIFFRFGGIIQLRSVLGIIYRSLTRILSGAFIGTAGTALYDLGEKFPNTATSIPVTGLFVSLPASSHLFAKGENERVSALYIYGCRYMSLISGLLLGFIAPFSQVLVTFWLGPDPKYQIVAIILACFSIPYHIIVVTGPASAAFRSINRPMIELIYGIFEIGLALLGIPLGFYFFKDPFVVINLAIPVAAILSSCGYLLFTNHFFSISQKAFFLKVAVPGLLPYLLAGCEAIAVYFWFDLTALNRLQALTILLCSGMLYLILILPFYYFYLLEDQERLHLRGLLFKSH